MIKGYKVFDENWKCRDKQYTCPGKFEEDIQPKVCEVGMHFCEKLVDCFGHYFFTPKNKVAEVIAYGDIARGADKICTNKLEIIREVSWDEVLDSVNFGINNIGLKNTGNNNQGNYNTGTRNDGDANTGNYNNGYANAGSFNVGYRNSGSYNNGSQNAGNGNHGKRNTGHFNIGSVNSGSYNKGNCNSGDWNKGNNCIGCFNTEKQPFYMFNKPADDWNYEVWRSSAAYFLLNEMLPPVTEQLLSAGVPLKKEEELTLFEQRQIWWDNLLAEEREAIMKLPNFDSCIFKQITGIDVSLAL